MATRTARSAPPAVPYVDAATLERLLTPAEALTAVQRFFADHPRDTVAAPPRIHLPVPGRETVGLYMPAASGRHVAVKIVHLMPSRRPAVQAEIFFYDAITGELLYWGDGKPLTGRRTAAVSAAASLRLQPRCRTAVLYGTGVQAASHLAAFARAYPDLERVWVVPRSTESYQAWEAALPEALAALVRLSGDTPQHLREADCVITTTPAPEPLFETGDLPQHCHVVAVGSATAQMNEIPPEAFLQSRVWVDTRAALHEAGDCITALEHGWSEEQVQGDLFDLLADGAPATPHDGGRPTLFKSVGHAAQDLALLTRLWELLEAERR